MTLTNEELEERIVLLEQRNEDVDWMAANTAWVTGAKLHWIVGDIYIEDGWEEYTVTIVDVNLSAAIEEARNYPYPS